MIGQATLEYVFDVGDYSCQVFVPPTGTKLRMVPESDRAKSKYHCVGALDLSIVQQ